MKAKSKAYVEIVAECSVHGRFRAQRKPNRRPDNGSGRINNGLYDAVKCPVCPFWATIIFQTLFEVAIQETEAAQLLPGVADA